MFRFSDGKLALLLVCSLQYRFEQSGHKNSGIFLMTLKSLKSLSSFVKETRRSCLMFFNFFVGVFFDKMKFKHFVLDYYKYLLTIISSYDNL